jgi:hypothetical protein
LRVIPLTTNSFTNQPSGLHVSGKRISSLSVPNPSANLTTHNLKAASPQTEALASPSSHREGLQVLGFPQARQKGGKLAEE